MASHVFVASTLPFTIGGRAFIHNTLGPVLRTNGLTPLFPEMMPAWRPTHSTVRLTPPSQSPQIRGAADAAAVHLSERYLIMLNEAESVLALLDGPDVDSGVAAVIGLATAIKKPVIGWRSDLRRSGEPIARLVNVFVEQLIIRSGGLLTTDLDHAIRQLMSFRDDGLS